jgi:PEP-CTERM/exosortase A-associated glycosyltransferase
MKILHVFDHSVPLHSGYTFRSRAILLEQAALGWQTCQVTSSKQGRCSSTVEDVDGLFFYRTPSIPSRAASLPVLQHWFVVRNLAQRLAQVIDIEKPDLIHAHSPALNGLAALQAGCRVGIPVVYECRAFWEDAAVNLGTGRPWGPRYRLTRALETHVFRRADAVTCICEGLRRDIVARGIPSTKVAIIPNAVDADRFAYSAPRDEPLAEKLGLSGSVVLGFIGSFYEYEGLDLLIRSMPKIVAAHPNARLLLVGGGPRANEMQKQVVALGLQDRVVFTGRVAHSEVERYYSLIDVLVYPRRAMRLTELVTPLKPLEAMAQGKLLVASDVAGHRELILDGETGRLFKAGDPDALVDTVLDMLSMPCDWEAYRAAGRAYVENTRTWRASVSAYAAAYDAVLGKTRSLGLEPRPPRSIN